MSDAQFGRLYKRQSIHRIPQIKKDDATQRLFLKHNNYKTKEQQTFLIPNF